MTTGRINQNAPSLTRNHKRTAGTEQQRLTQPTPPSPARALDNLLVSEVTFAFHQAAPRKRTEPSASDATAIVREQPTGVIAVRTDPRPRLEGNCRAFPTANPHCIRKPPAADDAEPTAHRYRLESTHRFPSACYRDHGPTRVSRYPVDRALPLAERHSVRRARPLARLESSVMRYAASANS